MGEFIIDTNNSNNLNNSTIANYYNSQNLNLGLNKFSYADFVLLSSTISYAIAEEVNVEDLEILVTFLGMISADLGLLLIKKERELITQQSNQQGVQTSVSEVSDEESDEDVDTISTRMSKKKRIKKRIKKKHRVKN